MSPSACPLLCLLLSSAVTTNGLAQQAQSTPPDITLTPALRNEVIEGTIKQLNAYYVFPDVARQMEAAIRKRAANHEYDQISSPKAFVDILTVHLRDVSHDKHLGVMYSASPLPPLPGPNAQPSPEQRERALGFGRAINFGFEKVERLPGNVGYLRLGGFFPPDMGAETAAAAMTFVANTDALIIDLRWNNGGDPAMVAFISTYLFNEPTHLNDIYWRPDSSTRQWWTLPHVPGTRFQGKDVYVLTSKRTFSAGEEFTNNLKVLKRATIVGDTTGGGANPGGPRPINDHFAVWVPSGRAINPVTKGNWEGTGVIPDVPVGEGIALETAYLAALEKLAPGATNPMLASQIKKATDSVRAELGKKGA
jgi:hypothetical protein